MRLSRKSISLVCVFFALTLGSAGLAPLAAQERSDRLAPLDVFQLRYASDPQISPDGRQIVYVLNFSDILTDRRYANLWIVNFDGTNNRPVTTGNRRDTSPRWSPDGTRIAYVSEVENRAQVHVRWMDTGQTAQITRLENPPSGIAWSPDAKFISFATLVPEAPPRLASLPSPPAGAQWAEAPKVYDKLIYRFNGVGYLKPGYTQIFIVSAEGGTPRQISSGSFQHGGQAFQSSSAVWSPDGKSLFLSANRRPDYEYEPLDTEVYEFSVADGVVRALTNRRGPDNAPAISPDGSKIAYTGFDDRYQGHQTTRLYLMNRDGSGTRVLTDKLDRDAQSPRWAPSGSGLYFTYDDQGDTKLAFISLDGIPRIVAAHLGAGASAGGGGASAFSVARNGNIAFAYADPKDPGDIAVITASDANARVITNVNQDLFAQKQLGEVEEFWYSSSRDARKIQGWIIKPPHFDSSRKYPLILEIHGGPFANYGARFDLVKQLWAAQDYVVLYTNPRGSTSYGEEFANLIHHAYPGDDYYDLNSGVDAAIAKGYVDPDNLFVTGGSGGGVLTCWMIDHTTRFRAAASLYPVINWESWVLTSDLPSFGAKYWFPGLPWDSPENYQKRSLLSLVKNVKTPTLLMTGEADYRTPISEAEQYYEALKLLKVEAVLVRVPDEPHGVSQRPSHQLARIQYTAGWFDQHKKKP